MDTQTIDQSTFLKAVGTLMREAYIGPDNPAGTWFTDNEGDSGILGMLERVDAERASRVIGYPEGASIASHANHIRFALNLVNRAIRGEDVNASADWPSSWSTVTVSDAEWRELKDAIKSEFDTMIATLAQGPHWRDPMVLTATIGVVAHGAWHLGAIRQLIAVSLRFAKEALR